MTEYDDDLHNRSRRAAALDAVDTEHIVLELQSDAPDETYWSAISRRIAQRIQQRFAGEPFPPTYALCDLQQDVLIGLHRNLNDFDLRNREAFWAYVMTIAKNRLTDAVRAARAEKRNDDRRVDAETAELIIRAFCDPEGKTPSAQLRAIEVDDCVQRCVLELESEEAQRTYLLRRRFDWSFAEIAEATGRDKTSTVRTVFQRAQEKISDCLCRQLDDSISGILRSLR